MKFPYYMVIALGLTLSACQKQAPRQVTLVVSNETDHDIAGVIDGVPLQAVLDSLRVPAGTPLTIRDELGKSVTTQIFDDGATQLLLFETNTLAHGESIYYLSIGHDSIQEATSSAVSIKHYPQRKDDLLWENESAMWRAYGPELQTSGERAFGYDIWCKNTKQLIGDTRMLNALANWERADSLRKLEQPELLAIADSIGESTNFHHDHGDGMDCYAVGPTLGGGTAALLNDGQIVFPWAWKRHKILANGPLLAAVRLDYDTLYVGADTVFEHRTIITQKGTRFNIINVEYEGLTTQHEIAVGIAYHSSDDSIRFNIANKYMAYADPTDQPERNPGRVLIGTYVPSMTRTALEQGHLLCIGRYQPGETFTYYLGSGWSKGDCPSLSTMEKELKQMQEPARTVRIVVK